MCTTTRCADNHEYQLSVHDDGRVNTNPQQIALGITWNTANNTFANNILVGAERRLDRDR